MSHLYKRYLDGDKPLGPPWFTEIWHRLNELNELVKLYQAKFYTYEGYYELLQELDVFRPEIKIPKNTEGGSESSDELSDSAENDSPDSDD